MVSDAVKIMVPDAVKKRYRMQWKEMVSDAVQQ